VPRRIKVSALVLTLAVAVLAPTVGEARGAAVTTTSSTTAGAPAQTVDTTPAAPTTPAVTLPSRTVTQETTTTVQQTTIRLVTLPGTTTSTTSSSGGTASWVWVLIGILAVGLIVLIVVLARRGGGGGGAAPSPAEVHRRLSAAVASWAAQGWAIESQTGDSAVLRRGEEAMVVTVDQAGHVTTRPFTGA
jgi:hypothetical protein